MSLSGKLEIANFSDVGQYRPHNEGNTFSDNAAGLAILADGMGGHKAGEVASAIAVTAIHDQIKEGLPNIAQGRVDKETGLTHESILVKNSIIQANSTIYNAAESDPEYQGMGTTIIVTLFRNDQIIIAHVGDSRLYRQRKHEFAQVTRDHSLIQERISQGFYTPEEAAQNTPKNLITRALGADAKVQVDIAEEPVIPGDIYLLCSDGLNDMVNDEEIHLTLSKYSANLAHAGQELVDLANRKGGKDNISVILIRVRESFSTSQGSL